MIERAEPEGWKEAFQNEYSVLAYRKRVEGWHHYSRKYIQAVRMTGMVRVIVFT